MVYYYNKKIPSIDDIVVAKVLTITEYGIEVSLNEYNDIKGFINCGEVSRRKKVNLNKLLTIGKDVLLNVIQVDINKQMIDLSKRTISDEDIKLFNEKHKLHIQLYNLFKQLYLKLNNTIVVDDEKIYDFMTNTLFQIQKDFENEYILEKILCKDTNLEILGSINYDENITLEKFKNILDEYIDTKINRVKPELTETIKLMTYSPTGLIDLKYSMDYKNFTQYQELLKDFDIKINYITGSVYSLNITQKEFDLIGESSIDDAILIIKKEIKQRAQEKQIQNQIVI
jgi:translation initiation factor 2 alpha subunit (eIF-2alpha)